MGFTRKLHFEHERRVRGTKYREHQNRADPATTESDISVWTTPLQTVGHNLGGVPHSTGGFTFWGGVLRTGRQSNPFNQVSSLRAGSN